MNHEENLWQTDLKRIRDKLDRIERQHLESLESLRLEIRALESRIHPEETQEIIPEPIVSEPEVATTPPPLPPPVPQPFTIDAAEQEPATPEPEERDASFELQLGRVWLVRLGVVLLLSGMVLLGNYAYQNWIREMPNGIRLSGLFLAAGFLIESGRRLTLKPALQRPGEVILAGGLAFFYYCTFAAHQVERLRVIENPVVAAILLLGAAAIVAAVSWVRRAKATAVLGLLLASYSTMLQPIGWLSCVSSTLLAGAGLLCMRRPGWVGPGIAAMAGTYSAFLGWQLLGAAGGDLRNPAVLWFLPPVWVMFTLPAVSGLFRESMSGRARAWFTGGNNAAFFLLFSGLWLHRHQSHDYWAVCAVFGLLLILLGIIGRRSHEIAGGVNFSQGLALLTLALVLKLDGYHLALGLAMESLLLAAAFAKFRSKSELVFSVLAASGATLLMIGDAIPVWSSGAASLMLACASAVLVRGAEKTATSWQNNARTCASLVFFMSITAGIFGWSIRLIDPWNLLSTAAISCMLTAAALILDRNRKMSELGYGSLLFLVTAFIEGELIEQPWALACAGALVLIACVLWHRAESTREVANGGLDLKDQPQIPAWAFSIATVAAVWSAWHRAGLNIQATPPWLAVSGVGLIAMAVICGTRRLATCSAWLGLLSLLEWSSKGSPGISAPMMIALISLAGLGLLAFPAALERLGKSHLALTGAFLRLTAFLAACLFWWNLTHVYFGDGTALITIILTAIACGFRKPLPAETWGFLAVGVVWLGLRSLVDPWQIITEPVWRGGGVVMAWLLMASLKTGVEKPIRDFLGYMASGLAALWATQMLVMRDDWDAIAVLWTLLGVAAVMSGLWLRQRPFRQTGFILLGMALVKIFAVDVWNFETFMRVTSFMVLGAALILLGLFYNKFAAVLKRLMEEESQT